MSAASTARMMRFEANKKSILATCLIWFFLGAFGIHRMYLGRWISGVILLLLTLAGAGLWWLLDALLIPGMVNAGNNELVDRISR